MSEVKLYKWHREKIMTMEQIIRFQVVSYCCIEGIRLTEGQMETVVLLGIHGPISQARFCEILSDKGLFSTPVSARNTVGLLHKDKENKVPSMIVKDGKVRKMLRLKPEMGIVNNGIVMVDIKCITDNYRNQ